MRGTIGIIAAVVCGGMVGGCGVNPSQPPSIRYGEEACAHCRMIISDDRFAAALVTDTGETLKFDDIGCLVEHEADRQRSAVTYWVRSFKEDNWLDARTAAYVRSDEVQSPMGYGLAALPATAREAGPALQFADLPAALAARRRGPEKPPTPDT
jgi:copper chaperone NosL